LNSNWAQSSTGYPVDPLPPDEPPGMPPPSIVLSPGPRETSISQAADSAPRSAALERPATTTHQAARGARMISFSPTSVSPLRAAARIRPAVEHRIRDEAWSGDGARPAPRGQ
jgi:hypothetical protein